MQICYIDVDELDDDLELLALLTLLMSDVVEGGEVLEHLGQLDAAQTDLVLFVHVEGAVLELAQHIHLKHALVRVLQPVLVGVRQLLVDHLLSVAGEQLLVVQCVDAGHRAEGPVDGDEVDVHLVPLHDHVLLELLVPVRGQHLYYLNLNQYEMSYYSQPSMDDQHKIGMEVDPDNNRYPYCLVWTALPCLTCCLPCIGHTGICKSDGTIYDFVGRGPMHSGELAFGAPLKYLILDHEKYSPEEWDDAIAKANNVFCQTEHNLVTNNCHHHVAEVLNNLQYKGKSNWGQVDIAILALRGTHVSLFSYWVYLVFFIIVGLVLLI